MEIKLQKNGASLMVAVDGKIDTNTAVEFGQAVLDNIDNINKLVLDFTNVSYISSMGLRMLLECQKKMKSQQGEMSLMNVQYAVMEVLEMTGFTKILKIARND
ncbi:MAG: STAS domain-containing protein [Candidatus Gastranaerophilaceae bacterium]